MINIYLGTGPVSAYGNWEGEYWEGWWWEDAFTKRQSSDFSSLGASILCYKVIFNLILGVWGMRRVETGWEGTLQKTIVFSMFQLQRLASLFYIYS